MFRNMCKILTYIYLTQKKRRYILYLRFSLNKKYCVLIIYLSFCLFFFLFSIFLLCRLSFLYLSLLCLFVFIFSIFFSFIFLCFFFFVFLVFIFLCFLIFTLSSFLSFLALSSYSYLSFLYLSFLSSFFAFTSFSPFSEGVSLS